MSKKVQGPKIPCVLANIIDKANAFYRHMRLGREALPYFDDTGLDEATHFGLPVEFKALGPCPDALVPVLPWGAHPYIADC